MKRVRILGLCLAATFAIAAVGASAASAKLPEFGGCEAAPTHEGKYADAGCVEPVKKVYGKYTGGYEWVTGAAFEEYEGLEPYNFKNGAIGATTFETTGGTKIQCAGGELRELEIQGPKNVGEVVTIFEGCESEGKACAGKFERAGKISDEVRAAHGEGFKGELVYVSGRNTSTPTVGLTLTSFNAGEPLFTVVCEGSLGTVEIGGAGGKKTEKAKGNTVVSLIEPVDEMVGEGEEIGYSKNPAGFTQTFAQTGGVQEPAKAENGKAKSLQMFSGNENKWVQLGFASTFQLPPEEELEPVEIKAAP